MKKEKSNSKISQTRRLRAAHQEKKMTSQELKQIRKRLKLSQQAFAELIGYQGGLSVSSWERGKVKIPGMVEKSIIHYLDSIKDRKMCFECFTCGERFESFETNCPNCGEEDILEINLSRDSEIGK